MVFHVAPGRWHAALAAFLAAGGPASAEVPGAAHHRAGQQTHRVESPGDGSWTVMDMDGDVVRVKKDVSIEIVTV